MEALFYHPLIVADDRPRCPAPVGEQFPVSARFQQEEVVGLVFISTYEGP